ncbi:MAG: heme ABC exporter ATP-binding protein CcmA [Rhodospirillaceae bacterium]|nr:heme ABC exporter ATP-binding protein CcmA [Rhodospirillaceae bacterium]|tara:strand:+ start:1842 stop:2453 length:612 start_codon:yes stop_codon:yes gene_type:complete
MKNHENSIILENVSCARGNRTVINNVSLKITSGKNFIIKGQNGSGKSTFLRMLAGFQKNVNGKILFNGESIFTNQQEYQNNIFYLSENNPIKNTFSCYENLFFWAEIEGMENNIQEALKFQKLENLKNLPAKFLSMGQKRRLNLSRLAITQKKIWLLDEPVNGLDEESILRLCELIKKHLANKGIVVIATHVDLNLETDTFYL